MRIMYWEAGDEEPPLPSSSPPDPAEPLMNATFALRTESPSLYTFNLGRSTVPSPPSFVDEFQYRSQGISIFQNKRQQYFEPIYSPETSSSWAERQIPILPPMIVEEVVSSDVSGRPVTPRSIGNSLDSLSECAQHHSDAVNANANSDRSRSLGDLLLTTNQEGNDSLRNGSYDTLVSKGGLTDSGIGAGLMLMRDEMDMEDNTSSSPDRIPTDISSPDSFSYPAVLFASYDPVSGSGNGAFSYSNENTNPLDSSSRGHSTEDRKYSELPAITEESEHEQSIHIPFNHQLHNPHSYSVGPPSSAREVVEHTYPMVHCNSAPSNSAFINNNIAHRRVVSDDATDIIRLKRSEEMENMDKIGRISFEKRSASSHNLKKGRCKSAMLVFQSDLDDREETDDEDNVDGYSKDNEMLIVSKGMVDEPYRITKMNSPLRHFENHSNLPSISSDVPPPVRLSRKVSAAAVRSPSYKSSDQSWKDKMPPFGMVGHTMYSPQSLPTRDVPSRSALEPGGTISGASCVGGSQRIGKNKKEKSGSDTFTFGNFFKKKTTSSRPNLADIISDLDQRSTSSRPTSGGGSLSVGSTTRRSTSATILPMSSIGASIDPTTPFDSTTIEGLPDHISRMVSPLDGTSSPNSNGASPMHSLYIQLNRLYGKYNLFDAEEYQSWHEKYRHNTLSTKQVKKQDAIFELYLMEKRHCANIAFLLHGYRRRMLEENIISKVDMNVLIPDVLEPLLIFHLNLLERITARMQTNFEVGTISDIISEELAIDEGQHTKLCCDAYTDFGVAKERSDVLYHHLMNKNVKFSEFFKRTYSEEPFYKHYDFRPLITKIIGRATKYSLLLETILKNEQPFSEYHDLTKNALETARKFAHKIDENLSMAHMSMKWEEIKGQIDSSSCTNLYVSDPSVPNGTIRYNFDLDSLNSAPNRKLVYLGEAFIKIPNNAAGGGTHSSSYSGKQVDKKDLCYIVLFDDIIIILIRKGTRQLMFMQDQGAMSVQSLLIRTAARGHSIMLISGAKPVLFEISFHTSTDRKKWVTHLEAAPKNAPSEGIRINTGDADGVLKDRVAAQQDLEDKWLKRLEELFDSRLPEEETLAKYLESRLNFFDEIREHVSKLPFKSRTDISNRIREAVKARFRELRRVRVIPLNKLIERMSESRDADLWSYFDEKADAADVIEKSSDLSEDSDSSDGSAAGRGAKPRRIQTFHGTSQQQGSNGATENKNTGIRRHTTVPRMNNDGVSPASSSAATDRAQVGDLDIDEEDTAAAQSSLSARGRGDMEIDRKTYGEMISDLPIRQTMRARKASTKLIKEVISLRRENHLLKNDNALTKSRCALLERVRGGGAMMSSTATAVDESMEMLRKKEKEIRELQKKLLADQDELLEKQKAIEAQEIEMQSKWAAIQSRSVEPSAIHTRTLSSHSQLPSPNYKTPQQQQQAPSTANSDWSPVLTSLATKTETRKIKK